MCKTSDQLCLCPITTHQEVKGLQEDILLPAFPLPASPSSFLHSLWEFLRAAEWKDRALVTMSILHREGLPTFLWIRQQQQETAHGSQVRAFSMPWCPPYSK